MDFLKGKKSYIFAALAVLYGLFKYLSGDATMDEALAFVINGGAIAGLRAAISKASGF